MTLSWHSLLSPCVFLEYTRTILQGDAKGEHPCATCARPAPSRDLDSPEEIAEMVRRFYADVARTTSSGRCSTTWPRSTGANISPSSQRSGVGPCLGMPGYVGNPFRAHALVHDKPRLHRGPLRTVADPVPRDARARLDRTQCQSGRRAGRQRRPGAQSPPDRPRGIHRLHPIERDGSAEQVADRVADGAVGRPCGRSASSAHSRRSPVVSRPP